MKTEFTVEFDKEDWVIVPIPAIAFKKFVSRVHGNKITTRQMLLVWLCFAWEFEWEKKRPHENA